MGNQTHVNMVLQGSNHIARWRERNPDTRIELSCANLDGINLEGADLSNADMEKTSLRGTNLKDSNLVGANLTKSIFGAEKSNKKTEGALSCCTILTNADLRNADLCEAQGFEHVKGLKLEQLACVKLHGVKLPDYIPEDRLDHLSGAIAHVKYVRGLFITLIITCFYSWLTIWSASDANVLTSNSGLSLPLISVTLPVSAFFWVTPAIIISIYVYFLFNFRLLINRLSLVPRVFPNGTVLDDVIDPWIILRFVRPHLANNYLNKVDKVEYYIVVFLVWWIVPITIIGFWQRYMVTNNFIAAIWLIFCSCLSIKISFEFYRLAKSNLSGVRSTTAKRPIARWFFLNKWILVVASILLLMSATSNFLWVPYFWVANLENQDLSDSILRNINLSGANLHKADLTKADLSGVNLSNADLSNSILKNANLSGAILVNANMSDADLSKTVIHNANLNGAILNRVNLVDADVFQTRLIDAKLQYANLRHAVMRQCNFNKADLFHADLSHSELDNSEFAGSKLSRAKLFTASMLNVKIKEFDSETPAYLVETNFTNAIMTRSRISNSIINHAIFNGAVLRNADFSNSTLENSIFLQAKLEYAKFDDADLKHANFSHANLTNARFMNADLSGSIFPDAILVKTNLAKAILHNADLRESYCYRIDLLNSKMHGMIVESNQWYDEVIKSAINHDKSLWYVSDSITEDGELIQRLESSVEAN